MEKIGTEWDFGYILVPFLPERENGTPHTGERRLAKNLAFCPIPTLPGSIYIDSVDAITETMVSCQSFVETATEMMNPAKIKSRKRLTMRMNIIIIFIDIYSHFALRKEMFS